PAKYRSQEDTQQARELDPVPAFRAQLIESGVLDDDSATAIDADAEKQVAAAVAFADESPDPEVADLFAYAYATPVAGTPHLLPGDPVVSVPGDEPDEGGRL
ncbi:MAG: thiamine pyrophosphate-dependent enzyme, partial [Actinomycetota bacterium]|nr:thiamine pyrophosphate-dependent enzyme [Actinomycetota bacterium]